MSTSKPAWGGAGAWALEAERAEEEERHQIPIAASTPDSASSTQNFPSLKEAAATAGKSKKKKQQTLSLAEFTTGSYNKGLTHDELVRLPTGPRERSAEELDRSRLGGGFRNYGGGDGFRRRDGSDDEPRRRQSREPEFDQPSRADEVDNWARDKKTLTPSMSDSGRRDRYGALGAGSGAGSGGGFSRADETDDWSRGKKPVSSSSSSTSRYGGFGSGFRESAGSSDSDRWVRGVSLPQNGDRERPRLVLDPPKRAEGSTPGAEVMRSRPSPFGTARPREEVLKEKGLDWRKIDTEIEQKGSRPSSAQSSRPSSAHSSRPGSPGSVTGEAAMRVRPKVNPFGDAKPREVVLEEKGKDWRKIDLELEHKRVDRPESAEEKTLKEEIISLKAELNETEQKDTEEVKDLEKRILQMENDLERLIVELDNKVRFGQRSSADTRPGSGSGRVPVYPHPGVSEEPRVGESVERPRSGGSSRGDSWGRPVEENKWGFQGSRNRGSFGGSSDRLSTKDRW
ncbi:Eukaryotic translation initiation factor 4B1 [Rhynchospora pubera]|uniref:Eukaryotic translation initiation factor 4B1 n=1 Tax=Rhynchospora pubera TaxID=906938 RepID=A0AAV8D0H0_9POAL|nr:Eukaryotic translation initiation factor 4B1 [Rhynchospora pubera]